MPDIVRSLCDKLIRRHPHVFGNVKADTSEEVLKNWERIKSEERKEKNQDDSILSGVPNGLPPLLKADRLQAKAQHIGFDWPLGDNTPMFEKLDEEIQEFKDAVNENNQAHMSEELGDILFMIVNIARRFKINADSALSSVCEKFKARFNFMERAAKEQGFNLSDCSLEKLDDLWNKAKVNLKNSSIMN